MLFLMGLTSVSITVRNTTIPKKINEELSKKNKTAGHHPEVRAAQAKREATCLKRSRIVGYLTFEPRRNTLAVPEHRHLPVERISRANRVADILRFQKI